MNISKDSWHYWMLHTLNIEASKSLCTYFWQVVGLLVLGLVTVAPVLAGVQVWLGYPTSFVQDMLFGLGLLWWAAVLLVGCIVAVIAGCIWVYEKYIEDDDREPNVFLEYVRAKKRKVCPILNFVD